MSGRFQEQIPQNLLMQEEFQFYDYPSEIGLLACMVRTPAIMPEVERQIRSDHFNLQLNRSIYEVMVWMYQQAARNAWPLSFNRIQLLTSSQQLSHHHHQALATQQGVEHLTAIEQVAQSATPEQAAGYMHTVVDRSLRVQQFRMHRQRMLTLGDFTRTPDPRAAAVETEIQFGSLAAGGYSDEYRITPLGNEWASFMDKSILNRTYGQAGLFNVHCPLFPFWMSLMNGGFRRRGMTIIAARPKVGKSTMLLCIAMTMAMMGIPTLYMDSEMSREEMFSRALSNISLVMEHNLIRGRFAAETGADDYEAGFADRQLLNQWLPHLQRAPLYYVNVAGKGADHMASMMRQFRNSIVGTTELTAPHNGQKYTFSNPAMCIYDWMKLPDPSANDRRAAKEHEALGYYASALKDSAFSLDLPLAAGAQNNRGAIGVEGEDWETMAESFVAGSDRLAQFCTQLAVLRNLSIKEEDLVRSHFPAREGRRGANALYFNQMLHVVFQRGGMEFRSGIPMHLDRGFARYTEMAHQEMFDFCRDQFRRQPRATRPNAGLPSNRALNNATAQAQQHVRGAV